MDNKLKFYIGRKFDLSREVISAIVVPTKIKLGHKYVDCLGPFENKAAAEYMAGPGWDNPNCISVKDAERLIKEVNHSKLNT